MERIGPRARQDGRRHGGPRCERARLLERDGLIALVLGAIGDDLGRHVMQEVGLQVEVLGVSARPLGGPAGFLPPGRLPPFVDSLPWRGDHRVEQHQAARSEPRADRACGERAHRLCDDDEVVVTARGRECQLDVGAQAAPGSSPGRSSAIASWPASCKPARLGASTRPCRRRQGRAETSSPRFRLSNLPPGQREQPRA
jgi:hypothetical protein